MTEARSRRRGHGEDSIYWDSSKNRYIGSQPRVELCWYACPAQGPGAAPKPRSATSSGNCTGKPTWVIRPRLRYTVGDALDDWLAYGLDGVSARTVTLYQGTIVAALKEELDAVRLRDLTASRVQGALATIAARTSSRTVQIARNVLVRAIQHAVEAGTGVGKSLAYLVPAILWAVSKKKKAIVSTYTINLQEQLVHKDLPILQKVLEETFEVMLWKGRQNYRLPDAARARDDAKHASSSPAPSRRSSSASRPGRKRRRMGRSPTSAWSRTRTSGRRSAASSTSARRRPAARIRAAGTSKRASGSSAPTWW